MSLLAVATTAQCFESNFGTLLGVGDDLAFPSTTTANPMNITFPMGGTFANYTHITANTNGCVFLWNAATGVVGATGTGYSTVAATQLTNLRGAVGGAPRIAPLWRDLNLLAANSGGLWLNNSIAGKCVITWANAVQFGSTSPIFTVQAQLFATGDIQFYYNGTLASTSATITGVSQGGAIASVPGVNLNPGPNVAATPLIYEQFLANTIDLQNTGLTFVAGGGGYTQTASSCIAANNSTYGVGCYSIVRELFHEFFATPALASAALQGNAMQLTPTANGYAAVWIPGGAALYVAPGGGATNVNAAPADDTNSVVTPTTALPIPGGTTATINVMSNGVISMGSTATNPNDFTPTAAEFATHTIAAHYTWHDWNENESSTAPAYTSGRIKKEEVVIGGNNNLVITWDNVESYADPDNTQNPGTIQYQFDLVTGVVTVVWQAISTDGTETTFATGIPYLVGYSGPGASSSSNPITLSTGLPVVTSPNVLPLTLSASPAPIFSTGNPSVPITYTINNVVDAAPPFGIGVPFLIFSVGQIAGGIDLGPLGIDIGAGGCNLYIASLDVILNPTGTAPTSTITLSIPQPLSSGTIFYAQAVSFFAPNSLPGGLNNLGAVFSNGLRQYFETF